MGFDELDALLNKQLAACSGSPGSPTTCATLLAEEQENEDRRARLAIDIFCLRVRKYIGAYLARDERRRRHRLHRRHRRELAGDPPPDLRRPRLARHRRSTPRATTPPDGREGEIGAEGSRVALCVIPTNEELLIARDTVRCVLDAPRRW